MESRFGGDNGSHATTFGLAGGDTFVGLGSTSVGTLDFGKISASTYTQGILVEVDRTGNGNNFGTTTILSDIGSLGLLKSRVNNVIRYKTPSLGGFVGTLAVSPSSSVYGGGEEGKITSATMAQNNSYTDGIFIALGGTYSNGPIYVNAYYSKLTAEGISSAPRASMLATDYSAARLSGSYRFPFGLKVGLSIDKSAAHNLAAGAVMGTFTNGPLFGGGALTAATGGGVATGGAVTRTAWLLPVTYIMGDHGFYAKVGKAGNLSNTTVVIYGIIFPS